MNVFFLIIFLYPDQSFSSLPSLSPPSLFLHFSLEKDRPPIVIKQTWHIEHEDWALPLVLRLDETIQYEGKYPKSRQKSQRESELPHNSTKQLNHNTYSDNLGHSHMGSLVVDSISVGPYGTGLVDSEVFLVVSLTPQAPISNPPLF